MFSMDYPVLDGRSWSGVGSLTMKSHISGRSCRVDLDTRLEEFSPPSWMRRMFEKHGLHTLGELVGADLPALGAERLGDVRLAAQATVEWLGHSSLSELMRHAAMQGKLSAPWSTVLNLPHATAVHMRHAVDEGPLRDVVMLVADEAALARTTFNEYSLGFVFDALGAAYVEAVFTHVFGAFRRPGTRSAGGKGRRTGGRGAGSPDGVPMAGIASMPFALAALLDYLLGLLDEPRRSIVRHRVYELEPRAVVARRVGLPEAEIERHVRLFHFMVNARFCGLCRLVAVPVLAALEAAGGLLHLSELRHRFGDVTVGGVLAVVRAADQGPSWSVWRDDFVVSRPHRDIDALMRKLRDHLAVCETVLWPVASLLDVVRAVSLFRPTEAVLEAMMEAFFGSAVLDGEGRVWAAAFMNPPAQVAAVLRDAGRALTRPEMAELCAEFAGRLPGRRGRTGPPAFSTLTNSPKVYACAQHRWIHEEHLPVTLEAMRCAARWSCERIVQAGRPVALRFLANGLGGSPWTEELVREAINRFGSGVRCVRSGYYAADAADGVTLPQAIRNVLLNSVEPMTLDEVAARLDASYHADGSTVAGRLCDIPGLLRFPVVQCAYVGLLERLGDEAARDRLAAVAVDALPRDGRPMTCHELFEYLAGAGDEGALRDLHEPERWLHALLATRTDTCRTDVVGLVARAMNRPGELLDEVLVAEMANRSVATRNELAAFLAGVGGYRRLSNEGRYAYVKKSIRRCIADGRLRSLPFGEGLLTLPVTGDETLFPIMARHHQQILQSGRSEELLKTRSDEGLRLLARYLIHVDKGSVARPVVDALLARRGKTIAERDMDLALEAQVERLDCRPGRPSRPIIRRVRDVLVEARRFMTCAEVVERLQSADGLTEERLRERAAGDSTILCRRGDGDRLTHAECVGDRATCDRIAGEAARLLTAAGRAVPADELCLHMLEDPGHPLHALDEPAEYLWCLLSADRRFTAHVSGLVAASDVARNPLDDAIIRLVVELGVVTPAQVAAELERRRLADGATGPSFLRTVQVACQRCVDAGTLWQLPVKWIYLCRAGATLDELESFLGDHYKMLARKCRHDGRLETAHPRWLRIFAEFFLRKDKPDLAKAAVDRLLVHPDVLVDERPGDQDLARRVAEGAPSVVKAAERLLVDGRRALPHAEVSARLAAQFDVPVGKVKRMLERTDELLRIPRGSWHLAHRSCAGDAGERRRTADVAFELLPASGAPVPCRDLFRHLVERSPDLALLRCETPALFLFGLVACDDRFETEMGGLVARRVPRTGELVDVIVAEILARRGSATRQELVDLLVDEYDYGPLTRHTIEQRIRWAVERLSAAGDVVTHGGYHVFTRGTMVDERALEDLPAEARRLQRLVDDRVAVGQAAERMLLACRSALSGLEVAARLVADLDIPLDSVRYGLDHAKSLLRVPRGLRYLAHPDCAGDTTERRRAADVAFELLPNSGAPVPCRNLLGRLGERAPDLALFRTETPAHFLFGILAGDDRFDTEVGGLVARRTPRAGELVDELVGIMIAERQHVSRDQVVDVLIADYDYGPLQRRTVEKRVAAAAKRLQATGAVVIGRGCYAAVPIEDQRSMKDSRS